MPSPSLQRWAFFLAVTLLLALPLAAAYLIFSDRLFQAEHLRHQNQIDAQLNTMQEQLYDATWDSLADTYDDTLHLAGGDAQELISQTLMWYVYPAGHSFVEGVAVVDPAGRLTAKAPAVINDEGQPLSPEKLAELKMDDPWLDNPWLDSYRFVAQAFLDDPELEFYRSPLIQAPGRAVFVVASARRDEDGRFLEAVVMQNSVKNLWRRLLEPAARDLDLWIVGADGMVALATSDLARASARHFISSGGLERAIAAGAEAAERGDFGAAGRLEQEVDGQTLVLNYRSDEDALVLGVAQTRAALGAVGAATMQAFGIIALVSLLLLACSGAVYTVASLRRESSTVEKDTLRRYAGTVSHQVRNSLSTLEGNLELIATGRVEAPPQITDRIVPACQESLDDIRRTVEELEALSQGHVDIGYQGQAGQGTMFRLDRKDEEGAGK